MRGRFDFTMDVVSPDGDGIKQEKIVLRSLLDSPSEGMPQRACQRSVAVLRRAKRELDRRLRKYGVRIRLSMEDETNTLFWYLLVHRPVTFDPAHPLGRTSWSIHKLMNSPYWEKLTASDLGVVYDKQYGWLGVIWHEAIRGILYQIETCPSWHAVTHEQRQRNDGKEVHLSWWKNVARSHDAVVPRWMIPETNMEELLRRHGVTDMAKVVVLDVNRADLTLSSTETLPLPRRASFVNVYVRNETVVDLPPQAEILRELGGHTVLMDYQTKEFVTQEEARNNPIVDTTRWKQASIIVRQLVRAINPHVSVGWRQTCMPATEAKPTYEIIMQLFQSGNVTKRKSDWRRVWSLLGELEECLQDQYVPQEMAMFLEIRTKIVGYITDKT